MASEAAGIPYIQLMHERQVPVQEPVIYALRELWDYLELDSRLGERNGRP